jgi:hypothetical protein
LLLRAVELHEAFCPLDVDDVINAITQEEERAAWMLLRHRQFYVPMAHSLQPWVRADEDVKLPAKVNFISSSRFPMLHTDPLFFDLDTLDDDKRQAFVEWLNAATRQRRIFKTAKALTDAFVDHHCGDSIASLHTRWPEFTIVLIEMGDPWPTRARNLTSIKRSEYDWPRSGETYDWYLDNMRKLEIVGGLLAEAQMLSVPEEKNALVRASVVDWKVEPS